VNVMPSGGMAIPTVTVVSIITPSLLFEELDLQRNKEPLQKVPIVASPLGRR
jgi:hypothetical protein